MQKVFNLSEFLNFQGGEKFLIKDSKFFREKGIGEVA